MSTYRRSALFCALALLAALSGCGPSKDSGNEARAPRLKGSVSMDGSSTVSPIMEAVSEEFVKANPDVRPTVGVSGTGGGFKKFVAGEIDIANASRPIEASEIEAAKKAGVEFVELPIAFDGLSVVVNASNTFVQSLTVAELKKIWEPNSTVKNWSDVRPGFPKEKIVLYGPGTDSGTFDYFTKAIVGEEKSSRSDYQASEDDQTLVQGVAGDKGALGYFGYAYVKENQDKLRPIAIDTGDGKPVAPSAETIANGTYRPLSRPLFIYVNKKALDRPEVAAFVKFILTTGKSLIQETGYVPLPDEAYELVMTRAEQKTLGTSFKGVQPGTTITDILSTERGG